MHEDRDPSWHMGESGSWYCFGCTRGGGPADLVAAVLEVPLRDALRWIDEQGLSEDAAPPTSVRVVVTPGLVLGARCSMPPEVRSPPWEQWPTPVRRYVEGRGIGREQVERWRVGYALHGPLASRVVFPVEDEAGRLRSWMARAFDDAAARYLTPKDGDRGAVFGQKFWPRAEARKSETLFVTEGAINALACERAGARFVGALGGSNTKFESKRSHAALEQFARVSSFGRIVVVSDPDGAGERVAAALASLARHLDVRRARLPPGKDAADLARESPADLERVLCLAVSPRSAPRSEARSARASES